MKFKFFSALLCFTMVPIKAGILERFQNKSAPCQELLNEQMQEFKRELFFARDLLQRAHERIKFLENENSTVKVRLEKNLLDQGLVAGVVSSLMLSSFFRVCCGVQVAKGVKEYLPPYLQYYRKPVAITFNIAIGSLLLDWWLLPKMNIVVGDISLTKKILINVGYCAHSVGAAVLANHIADTV